MRVQIFPNGQVEVLDRVIEGPVALAAYHAEEAVVALRFTEPLVHNGLPVPEFSVQVFRVFRVAKVTDNDVVTAVEPPILVFAARPHRAQFGPSPT